MQPGNISERRPSGIAGLDDLPWGAHFCHFYRGVEDLAEVLVRFFQAGLEANERCLWVASESVPAPRARRLLRSALPSCVELEAQGKIEVLECGDWCRNSSNASFDALLGACLEREVRALANGAAGLRVAGNAFSAGVLGSSDAVSAHARAAPADCRARVHEALQGRRILALGSSPLEDCSVDDLLDVLNQDGAVLVRDGACRDLILRAGRRDTERRADSLAEVAVRHLARLQRVTSALSEAVSIADVCRVLRSEMAEAVAARRAFVALASEAEGALSAVADRAGEVEARLPEPAAECPETWGLLEQAYREHRAIWPSPPSRVLTLPLGLGPRMLGAVAFELEQAREIEPAGRALFEDLARQLALALDRARMYELARQECERAEEANQAKDEFLAVLGHELRNPLAPMLTALELMRLRAGGVAVKERSIIERQLNHMVRLVDDLLDVGRITRGSLRISRSRVELSEVVERAIEMASPILDERSHQLTISVPMQGVPVDVDAHRVAQAIANLLVNAAKYTPQGGSIEVAARMQGERVFLEVRDDGIGIEPALLLQIFEPFVQRKQALDRSRGGLGLGLTIARRLIELNGGRVVAASEGSGAGSAFTIELALSAQRALPELHVAAEALPDPLGGQPVFNPVRVLVVDDNVDAAEMLAEALRENGHLVGVAHDGPAALSLADEFCPDLALLDIGLPVMDGFDLARHLKRRLCAKPPKFIAVTGYGQPSDRARSKQAGFDEHLVKPVDLARLNAIVHSLER